MKTTVSSIFTCINSGSCNSLPALWVPFWQGSIHNSLE